jgi:tetratricopeptide (TPR) repeat protein/glycosyltransferase involved in cell wall biosynthesis/ADP-heptose:LPS heptosyltransferase
VDFQKISELLNQGRSHHESGRRQEAIQFYRQVLDAQPHNLEALNNLAIALKQEKQFTEAIALLRQALTIEPNAPYLHNNLANILWQENQLEAAKAHYQQALTANSNYADAWYGLGNVFASLGELDRAINSYQQALSRNPNYPETYNNLGNVLQAQGKLKEALDCYKKTLELNPNHPGARWNQGFTLLLAGELQRGFTEYEWRWQMRGGNFRSPRNFSQPLWDGSDILGQRILLHCEQGFGDTIQFVRYVDLVKQRVGEFGRVILECPKPLFRLCESLLHLDQLIVEGHSLPEFDVYAPLMSLPRILGTTLATIPADIPYLYAEDIPTSFHLFKQEAGGREIPWKIGIVWAGNPFYQGDRSRYRACSPQHFLQLLDYKIAANLPMQLYSLQKEVTEAELSLLSANNIRDIGSKLKDFADTANAIAPLDLVITVDTAVAHLAGAMGKPVWVLLPFAPDWRWMLNRVDSPWYPSIMRLFRQPKPGDWEGVFDQVKLALKDLINRHLPGSSAGSPLTPLTKGETGSNLNPPPFSRGAGGDLHDDLVAEKIDIDLLHKQGVSAYQGGNLSEAIAYYRQVLEINPNYAKTHNNLAVALKQQGNLLEAIGHYRQAVKCGDANELPLATIYHNLAVTLEEIGQFAEAIREYQSAINLSPNFPEAHYNLARLLENAGQTEAAIWHYRKAIKYQPFAQAYSNLGNIFKKADQLAEAIQCYEQAISIKPDYAEAHWNLGISLLITGDLKRGFAEYEWRWQTAYFPRRSFPQPLWDGKPLNGKTILLYSEQGLGDQIQFIRYVALVAQQGGRVILECPQPLARLFKTVPCVQQIVIKGEPLPEFDLHFPLISLPHLFGTTLETIPAPIPYLTSSPCFDQKIGDNSLLLNSNFNIGIVWAGNPNHKQDALRSCELKYFLPLLNLSEVKLYSLQKGDRVKDLATLGFDPPQPPLKRGELVHIENLDSQLNDFADTAAIVDQLDLVITVDTAVAHLAGAMGKPVWLLLGNHQDWRWMQQREDSPWYPTMRLFRQSQPGDWDELFQRVFSALETTLTSRRNSPDSYQVEVKKLQQLIAQQPDYEEISVQSLPREDEERSTEKSPDNSSSIYANFTSSKPMNLSSNARLRLGLGWQLSSMTGWGIYGMNLTLQLLKSPSVTPGFYPVLLMPPAINPADLNPLYRALLQPIFSNYQKLQELMSRNPGKQIACDFPVIQALGKNLNSLDIPRGNKNIGVIFLEDTNMTAEARRNAENYDIIIAGSTWNEKLLKHYGINHVCTVQQGIDPSIFHPAPKSNLWGDRFVIFSGGKLEFRKGQDIVIAAFKEFQRRHPEALLITAWHNFWPQYMQGLEQAGNVVGLPEVGENNQIKIAEWLIANGLPPDSFIDLGIVPNHQIGQILREADVAIFTSRCEGGTNLAAMETMACGIPTILSANTGHLDLIHDHHCYALSRQRPVQPTPHFFTGVVGWGESEVSEAISALERVYVNRREAQQKGLKAAKFMENWTWEKQVKRFLAKVADIL